MGRLRGWHLALFLVTLASCNAHPVALTDRGGYGDLPRECINPPAFDLAFDYTGPVRCLPSGS